MRHLSSRVLALARLGVVSAALPTALLVAQSERKPGNPEDHLPPNITQLTWFGERASWSPDGQADRLHVEELRRRVRDRSGDALPSGCSRHYPHAGFLRVQYLPNGDYFLIGARTFADIRTTRGRDQEMWIMTREFKPGDRAGASRPQDLRGGGHLAQATRIAWSNTRGQYPDLLGEGESVIYTADISVQDGRPALANKQEMLRARAPECTLEAQDFRRRRHRVDLHLLPRRSSPTCSASSSASRRKCTTYRKLTGRVQRGGGHLSGRRAHAGGVEPRAGATQDSNHIDLWKLRLEPNSADFVRMTRWGDFEGFKASNPVVAPDGKSFAFQSARSTDAAGVGYGIFLYRID